MAAPEICVLLLAAGRSARFGAGSKLLATLDGVAVVRRTAEAAVASGASDVIVVTRDDEVVRVLGGMPILFAQPASTSMGASIAAGVEAASDVDGWLVWPADMPCIRPRTAARVMEHFDAEAPVVPTHGGRRGHPVLFPARFAVALKKLTEDRGARDLLGGADRVVELGVHDPAIHLDIDTPDDLGRAAAHLR